MKLEAGQLHKLLYDLPSETYHAIEGTFSSSQFKDILKDEEMFINKHILKTIKKDSIPAFGTGTYFHSAVLEPDKLNKENAVFKGRQRKGREWDTFENKHAGKNIITSNQAQQAMRMVAAVNDSPVALGYLNRGEPEVSFFVELAIYQGCIYAPKYERLLTKKGWIEMGESWKGFAKGKQFQTIIVKVRADSIGEDFILDLKSTTGNAKEQWECRERIKYYQYDISATFYLDMFALEWDFDVDEPEFIWTFASKDMGNCKSYKQLPKNRLAARVKYMDAILKLAKLMKSKWQIYDSLGEIDVHPFEAHLLDETEYDFL